MLRIAMSIVVWGIIASFSVGLLADPQKVESFDDDPRWTKVGSGFGGNDFGLRFSSNAGGAPGEAGGHFTRSRPVYYFGDTNLGDSFTLDEPMMASGAFAVTDYWGADFGRATAIGHFSTIGRSKLRIGFTDSSTDVDIFWQPVVIFDDAARALSPEPVQITVGQVYRWSYNWNPVGGVADAGALTVTVASDGIEVTRRVEVTPDDRQRRSHFDAFGIAGGHAPGSQPREFADIYIDDLTYTGSSQFSRGDANVDGDRDIADAVFVLQHLFLGGVTPRCLDALDASDNGQVDISDPIGLLTFVFLGGFPPPPPFAECDHDPTGDELGCAEFPVC